ncbi:MAG: btuF 1 [Marmoricola sp.]|nr:btuF 1 [Marmoricola sp.]
MSAPRVVSLVPSITEALASVNPKAVVGATAWCTHPHDLETTRVRGTKNPDLGAIRRLKPDFIIANREENRELDVQRLRQSGLNVIVTNIETVPDAIETYERLFRNLLDWPIPGWLRDAKSQWCGAYPRPTRRVVMPIWRDPWLVVGSRTFANDLARRLGWENAAVGLLDRYPRTDVNEILKLEPDVIILPDEPYEFTAENGPEMFPGVPTELVSGRLLTWYGPSLLEAGSLK